MRVTILRFKGKESNSQKKKATQERLTYDAKRRKILGRKKKKKEEGQRHNSHKARTA